MAHTADEGSDREASGTGYPLFRELDPTNLDDLETSEISSLCMACGETVRSK